MEGVKRGYELFPVGTLVTDKTGIWFGGVGTVISGHRSFGWVIVRDAKGLQWGMEDKELNPLIVPSLDDVL